MTRVRLQMKVSIINRSSWQGRVIVNFINHYPLGSHLTKISTGVSNLDKTLNLKTGMDVLMVGLLLFACCSLMYPLTDHVTAEIPTNRLLPNPLEAAFF